MVARIPIAVAALVRDGLVLLVHRHPSRTWYPDCWDLVGGHVETGESPHQAVMRECFEELGVRIHDPLPVPMTFNDPTLEVHAFLVTRWDGEPVNSAPEEHDDLRWFRPNDLAGLELADPAALSSILSAVEVASAATAASGAPGDTASPRDRSARPSTERSPPQGPLRHARLTGRG